MNGYNDETVDYGDGYEIEETSHQSFCAKIGSSLIGVVVGLILVAGSVGCLFWNEGNAIHVAESLVEAKSVCVSASCSPIMPHNEGHLIHVACPVNNMEHFKDMALDVEFVGLKFVRKVEMFQWVEEKQCEETKDKFGGGTTTHCTYSYHKSWSSTSIDSLHFHSSMHSNPSSSEWPMKSLSRAGNRVGLGDFVLESDLLCGSMYYTGDCKNWTVGDIRVSFQGATASAISVLGQQFKRSFVGWKGKKSASVVGPYLVEGIHSEDEMFSDLQNHLEMLTVILRLGGFVVMWIGLGMMGKPLSVMPDIIPCVGPCIGDMIGTAVCCASLLIALSASLITISIAWLTYRPLIGIPILFCGVGCMVAFFYYRNSDKPNDTQEYAEVPSYDNNPPYPPPLYTDSHAHASSTPYINPNSGIYEGYSTYNYNPYPRIGTSDESGGPYPPPPSSYGFTNAQYPRPSHKSTHGPNYYNGGSAAQVGNYDQFPSHPYAPPGQPATDTNSFLPYPTSNRTLPYPPSQPQ
eukprot:CFRG4709T1